MRIQKHLQKKLEKLSEIKRKHYHHLLHKIHKKHNISKRTLFYIKEYGPHSNVAKTIIKESIKVLLLASIISSLGGLAIEQIKTAFISLIPLVIILPALNNMIGSYGTVISSKFATMLYEGQIKKHWMKEEAVRKLFIQILIIALITTLLSVIASLIASRLMNNSVDFWLAMKIFFIAVIDVSLLVSIIYFSAIVIGLQLYKKKEDPNNFLIPITTSIADFGNMAILALLVILFF